MNAIAEIQARDGHEAAVKAMLEAMVPAARAEEGCKAYHLLVDKAHPRSFYTYEEWTSEGALGRHLDGVKPTLQKAAGLLEREPRVTVLEHLI